MRRKRTSLLLAIAVLGSLLFALWPTGVVANGGTISAYLSVLPEVCNWGTTDASGQASVNVSEGRVEITARGLPALSDDVYEAWLVTPGLAQWVSVGRLVAAGGPIDYLAQIDEIPDLEYRYLVITVEPAEGDTGEPSGRNAIAGAFIAQEATIAPTQAAVPVVTSAAGVATPEAAATAAGVAAVTPAAPPPDYLPVSGAPVPPYAVVGAIGLAAMVAGSLALIRRR
ncbi:MAG: hypothetical protein ACYC5O_02835 [Anaerolineae bacterium]